MRVAIARQVYSERIEDEVVLLEFDAGYYYGLDSVAARLWQLLGELGSTEAVVEVASREFDVTAEQLARDLDAWVRELEERKLVVLDAVESTG